MFLLLVPTSCQDEDIDANDLPTTNYIPIDCETDPNCPYPKPPSEPPVATPKETAIKQLKSSPFYTRLHSNYKSKLNFSKATHSYSSTKDVTTLLIPLTGSTAYSESYLNILIPGNPAAGKIPANCIELIFGIVSNVSTGGTIKLRDPKIKQQNGRVGAVKIYNAVTGNLANQFSLYSDGSILDYNYTEIPGDIPNVGCTKTQAKNAERCFITQGRRHIGSGILAAFICPECVMLGVVILYVDCYLRECSAPASPKESCLDQLTNPL